MYLKKVNTNNTEDIRKKLIALCDCDADMNGNNGPDYLWEEAKGFKSNAEYLADYVMKNNKTVKDMFEEFMKKWMYYDFYYYPGYDLTFLEEDKTYLIIACALVPDDIKKAVDNRCLYK